MGCYLLVNCRWDMGGQGEGVGHGPGADFSDRILAANRSAMIALVPRVVAQPGALESRLTNDGAE